MKVMVLQIFRLLAQAKQDLLASMEKSRNMSSVRCIREFLMSENPNDLYFFISCIECIDVTIWASATLESQAVLEEKHAGRTRLWTREAARSVAFSTLIRDEH